jgi:hypothetical protein
MSRADFACAAKAGRVLKIQAPPPQFAGLPTPPPQDLCNENCWCALQGTIGGGPTYVERATEGTMSPGEIRACYRLYAAHRKSHRPALVGHFDHLRKMLASLAAQLFGRGALAAR